MDKNRGKEWKTPILIWKWVRKENSDTFPSYRSREIRWLRFYANVLLATVVWYAPFLISGGRRAVRVLKESMLSSRGGHCVRCGYDLRASADFHRCPECGTPFSGKSVSLTSKHLAKDVEENRSVDDIWKDQAPR